MIVCVHPDDFGDFGIFFSRGSSTSSQTLCGQHSAHVPGFPTTCGTINIVGQHVRKFAAEVLEPLRVLGLLPQGDPGVSAGGMWACQLQSQIAWLYTAGSARCRKLLSPEDPRCNCPSFSICEGEVAIDLEAYLGSARVIRYILLKDWKKAW